ncbi:MAG TPA: VOC family protein [Verrucomicrobiae bacterium]|nr:VOC family protein [Verrucomicrobiae bacterium]
MKNIDIYLHFHGNSEKAMNFYKKVFGGEFINIQRYKDVPGSEKMSDEDKEKMIHIALKFSEHTTLMASDVVTKMEGPINFGNNYHICLQASNEKEADKLFNALSDEGKIEMPMNKTFWGAYFGMCVDKFGIQWMINYTNSK